MEQDKKYFKLFNYLIWIEITVLFICMLCLFAVQFVSGSAIHSDFVLWISDLSTVFKIICLSGVTMITIIATILIYKAYEEKEGFSTRCGNSS